VAVFVNCSECGGEGRVKCGDCDGRGRDAYSSGACDYCVKGTVTCWLCEGEGAYSIEDDDADTETFD